jgi:exodeoxyribonuclease VII small subunit
MKKTKIDISANESTTNPVANFEQSLDELENLVGQLEHGEQSLEESLQTFERGIALYRQCQTALETAELRVTQLLDPTDPNKATRFDTEKS